MDFRSLGGGLGPLTIAAAGLGPRLQDPTGFPNITHQCSMAKICRFQVLPWLPWISRAVNPGSLCTWKCCTNSPMHILHLDFTPDHSLAHLAKSNAMWMNERMNERINQSINQSCDNIYKSNINHTSWRFKCPGTWMIDRTASVTSKWNWSFVAWCKCSDSGLRHRKNCCGAGESHPIGLWTSDIYWWNYFDAPSCCTHATLIIHLYYDVIHYSYGVENFTGFI